MVGSVACSEQRKAERCVAIAVAEDRLPRLQRNEAPAGIAFANLKRCNIACVSALENRDAGVFSVNNQ